MIPAQHHSLLQSIATTITDYRQGEIPPITPEHVEMWVQQFDPEDRPVILAEMDTIFKKMYFSRAKVIQCIRGFLRDAIIAGQSPAPTLLKTRFLQTQKSPSSQASLLRLVNEVLQEDYGVLLTSCGTRSIDRYVYLDDGIYTGNRLRCDMELGNDTPAWIKRNAPIGVRLFIYTLARHTRGYEYAKENIQIAARAKRLNVSFHCSLDIDDSYESTSSAECLWPERWTGEREVDAYVGSVMATCSAHGWDINVLFRPSNVPDSESLFSSPANRRIVERAFLKSGCKLRRLYNSPKPEIRPLGYEKLESLGFGSLFATYQNVANNCPIVMWWDLGDWYPLFPRRTNNQPNGMMTDDVPF